MRVLLLLFPSLLAAQSVSVRPDSIRLLVGDTSRVVATLRGAPDSLLNFSGTNATAFTAHRDGRITARAVGCGFLRVSAGQWTRAQVPVCVVAPTPPVPAPTPTLGWRSDWPTLGSTASALLDGGRWSRIGGAGLDIIPATGLDFPTPTVLRVTARQSTAGFGIVRADSQLGPLAIGHSRWYRHYARYVFPDNLSDGQSHPVQDGNPGSAINWAWSIRHNLGGPDRFTAALLVHAAPGNPLTNPWAYQEWTPPPLRKGVTYRFEWQVERVSETQFRLHVRIYDAAGTLVQSDADFRSNDGRTTLASNPLLLFNNPANLAGLNAGLNGISGMTGDFVYGYQSGFASSDRGWVGRWVP